MTTTFDCPASEAPSRLPPIAYLNVTDGAAAIDFYRQAFGAEEIVRIDRSDGKLAHAELAVAGGSVMLRDEIPEMQFLSPESTDGASVNLLIYVDDAAAITELAAAAGARVERPVERQSHGDDMAVLKDPFGHSWFVASRSEELSPAELRDRARDWGI